MDSEFATLSLSRIMYMDLWSGYHGSQWRYDTFADQWDLCSEFEPDAKSECSNDDSDDDPPMLSKKSYSSIVVTETSPPKIPPSSDTLMDSELPSDAQHTPHDKASPGNQTSACGPQPEVEPPSGDQPMPCDPLLESQASLSGQQLLSSSAPLSEQLMSLPEDRSSSAICIHTPLSRRC